MAHKRPLPSSVTDRGAGGGFTTIRTVRRPYPEKPKAALAKQILHTKARLLKLYGKHFRETEHKLGRHVRKISKALMAEDKTAFEKAIAELERSMALNIINEKANMFYWIDVGERKQFLGSVTEAIRSRDNSKIDKIILGVRQRASQVASDKYQMKKRVKK